MHFVFAPEYLVAGFLFSLQLLITRVQKLNCFLNTDLVPSATLLVLMENSLPDPEDFLCHCICLQTQFNFLLHTVAFFISLYCLIVLATNSMTIQNRSCESKHLALFLILQEKCLTFTMMLNAGVSQRPLNTFGEGPFYSQFTGKWLLLFLILHGYQFSSIFLWHLIKGLHCFSTYLSVKMLIYADCYLMFNEPSIPGRSPTQLHHIILLDRLTQSSC